MATLSEYTPTRNEMLTALFIYRATQREKPPRIEDLATPEQAKRYLGEAERGLAEVERAAAARARGEALTEVVQAHRDLHKTYGSTVACRGGIGGQALTSHCGEICYNADAHQKEMEAWQKLEVEAIEYSRTRAASDREEESR